MDKIEQFKNIYESIKKEPVYMVQYRSTRNIYEKKYIVKEFNLAKKEDLFSLLVGTYGQSVFSNKEDALKKANWLNEHENELDMDDYLEM